MKGKDEESLEGRPAIGRERACLEGPNPGQGLPLFGARCSRERGGTVHSGG